MKGSKLLQIISYIMLIAAALSLVVVLFFSGLLTAGAGGGFLFILLLLVLPILISVVELIAGIVGVKNWANPAKAKTCITLGIVVIVLSLISNIYSIVNGTTDFVSIVAGLVVPILYLIGAFQLKNQ